jgi:hypothetical protein
MHGVAYWKPAWRYKWEVYTPQKTCGWTLVGHPSFVLYCLTCEFDNS